MMWFLPSIATAQQLDLVLKELIQKGLDKSHSININNFDINQTLRSMVASPDWMMILPLAMQPKTFWLPPKNFL
jgi:ABC-type cobalamin transport system ATPase subunit